MITVMLLLCLVGVTFAADNNTTSVIRNWGSDGAHAGGNTFKGQNIHAPISGISNAVNAPVSNAVSNGVSNAVSFTPISTSGNAIDNNQKVAVYMADMTNPMYSETAKGYTTVKVTYDPLVTAMLYEYNPTYLGDANIASQLTVANYNILLVPMSQMSASATTAITNYIANGGSVWFLQDPCMTVAGSSGVQLTTLLGSAVSASTSSTTTITVANTDPITSGLSTSFKPVGTTAKTSVFRSRSGSGTVSNMNYQVLMNSGSAAMLVKYENPTNGARVIYSNPNMFVSGGSASYFNAQQATQLFMQTKAWVMKLALNQNAVQVTYPKSDKQFIVTCDDVEAGDWEGTGMSTMFNAETAAGVSPSAVNTIFVIPDAGTSKAQLAYYAANGDTHTLHPHVIDTYGAAWDVAGTSVATYQSNIAASKAVMNAASGLADYGFTSWRFPMTTFCANSMQAVSNSGITIESSSGPGTDGFQIGAPEDNTVLFPKQVLINNAKSNIVEMEIPACFDIDATSQADFYNQYNAYTTQFKGTNFPANFVVGGHYQGIGTGGLPAWGVSVTGLTAGLVQIINAEKAANPNFANFNTLANYINGIKTAKITATSSSGVTNVNVVNAKQINDFTLKVAIGGVSSATCDGVAIPASNIKTDSLTGATYVTQTIAAGSHTFVLSTTGGVTPPIPPTAQNSAQYVSDTLPSAMTTGQQYTASITMRNSGTTTWNEGSMIRLGGVGDGSGDANKFGSTRIYIPTGTNVAPNTDYTFTFTMTAPSTGTYNPKYQMVKDGVEWFGATLSKTITVSGGIAPPTKPTITVAPLSSSIVSGASVVFTATVGGNPAPAVIWTFGDGTASAAGTTVSHRFTRTGTTSITRTVTATATNSAGSTATTAKVIVSPNTGANTIPTITITPTTAAITAGSSVTFTATVGGKPAPTVTWKFGDGTAWMTGTTATHYFTNAGSTALTRTVTATAKNSVGSVSKTAKITVNPSGGTSYTKPAAYFTCSTTSGTTATTFTFTPDCDNNPTSYVWNFADGTTQTTTAQVPVTHKFAKTGSFDVRLDVYNPAGTDYDDHIVTVK